VARIRTIKHEFFLDEELARLPAAARLLFIGLWTLADRAGRIEDRPKRIRAELFPYEPRFDVDAALCQLAEGRFITRYPSTTDERHYLQIRSFARHQRPNAKEPESVIPPSPENTGKIDRHVPSDAGTGRHPGNGSLGMDLGKGNGEREGNGEQTHVELALDRVVVKPAEVVVSHYRTHHPKARPGDRETKLIRQRLTEGYSPEDLCRAIDGYHRSRFHCGENDKGLKYLGLELIMRDSKHVTAGIELAEARAGPVLTAKDRTTVSAGVAWLERTGAKDAGSG